MRDSSILLLFGLLFCFFGHSVKEGSGASGPGLPGTDESLYDWRPVLIDGEC